MKLSKLLLPTFLAASGSAMAQSFHVEAMHIFQAGDSSVDLITHNGEFPFDIQVNRDLGNGQVATTTVTANSAFTRIAFPNPITEGESFEFAPVVPNAVPFTMVGRQLRGDVNADGNVNISDAVGILNHLFGTQSTLIFSPMNADVNGSGSVDTADSIYLLAHLFNNGPAPVRVNVGPELCPTGTAPSACIGDLVDALSDPWERYQADYAYQRLYTIGTPAIDALLADAGTTSLTQKFSGRSCYNRNSSLFLLGESRVAAVELLLIEAMRLRQIAPYRRTEFFDDLSDPISTLQLTATVASFQTWNLANQTTPVTQRPQPTLPPKVYVPGTAEWPTPLLPHPALVNPSTGRLDPEIYCPNGLEPCCTDPFSEFQWLSLPPTPLLPEFGTPVSNCFAWAAGCRTDAWIQPTPGAPGDDFIEGLGSDPATGTPTPSYMTGEIMVTFEVCPNGLARPIHASKRLESGWSMKLGSGPFIDNIGGNEVEGIVELIYPPAPGKTLVHVYYDQLP